MQVQPQLYIMLNDGDGRSRYAQIAKVLNGKLVHYDVWPLVADIENVEFSAPPTAIGSIYMARVTKLDVQLNLAFVTLGAYDAVLRTKPKIKLREGQYILAEIISQAYDDKAIRMRQVGDAKAGDKNRPHLLKAAENLTQYCKNLATDDDCQIITDDYAFSAGLEAKVEMSKKNAASLFEKFNLAEQIDQLTQSQIGLENGGNIIIEASSAMTVIDVNSGAYTGNDMVDIVNQQAAIKIFEQLSLRNIGGLVVVDFLKYTTKPQRQKFNDLLRGLTQHTNIEMGSYTAFGLAELKIKRQGKNLAVKLLDIEHDR